MRSPFVYFSSGQKILSRFENLTSRGVGSLELGAGGCESPPPDSGLPAPGILTSSAFLSSRNRRNTDCRSSPSFVSSLYRTSHTSFGSTHVWSGPLGNCPPFGGSHGGVLRTNARSCSLTSSS